MKNIHIIITFLISLLLFGCVKKDKGFGDLVDLEVSVTSISEAYFGETSNLEVKANAQCNIKVMVDGTEKTSSTNGKLTFDVSTLPVGEHTITITVEDEYESCSKTFKCKILEQKPKTPKLTYAPVKQAYEGETRYIVAQTKTDSKITIYIDDVEKQSSNTKTLSYDVKGLAVGTHRIRIASINGDKTDEVSFECEIVAKPKTEESEYVDLGLPSGTLWATSNVGADNPWDYGDYFAWGEVSPKDYYSDGTYTYGDSPTTLDVSHDAATVNMGSNWRMPTKAEFQELLDYCEIEWTSNYNGTGVAGRIVWDTYSHSTHIFLPASGYRYGGDLDDAGSYGDFWSSSVDDSYHAWGFYFSSGYVRLDYYGRSFGQPVRAVRCHKSDNPVEYEVPTISLSYVTKAIEGEPEEITASTVVDSKITLYVDGVTKQTSNTKTLSYNVSELSIGTHQIKIVAVNGDKSDEREFTIEILAPTYIDDGHATIPDMGNEDL